jgi:hypothetical protein
MESVTSRQSLTFPREAATSGHPRTLYPWFDTLSSSTILHSVRLISMA